MGIYPKPFTDVMHVSVIELLKHVAVSKLWSWLRKEIYMQAIDLIAMLPELVLLTVACLLLLTVFMNEPQANDDDIFY
jgi:hypothetical protein